MNKLLLGIVIGLLAGGVATWSFLHHHAAGEEEEKEATPHESPVQHGTNGEAILKLDPPTQARIGLKVTPLQAIQLKHEIKVFGRVLDPAPLVVAVTDIAAARTQLEASTREFERLKLLHGQAQNVSTRALEVAEAAARRDQISVRAAELRQATSWGSSLASINDLPALLSSLAAQQAALVRVDLTLGQPMEPPQAARIAPIFSPEQFVEAEVLGRAAAVDPQSQAPGYLLLARTPLAAGAAVLAWLALPGEARTGVVIPRDAVVRHEGGAFVYVRGADDEFVRRRIEIDRPARDGWFNGELKAGVQVVTTGAQQLLSEERKGEAVEEEE